MVNHTTLQGRLTRDPEINTTPSGLEVAKCTVAWSEKYNQTETKCFLNCVAWRKTATFLNQYFRKGQEIAVEGKLTTRSYEDKQGNNRTVMELVIDKVHFCGSKADNQSAMNTGNTASEQPQYQTAQNNDFVDIEADDDLPF